MLVPNVTESEIWSFVVQLVILGIVIESFRQKARKTVEHEFAEKVCASVLKALCSWGYFSVQMIFLMKELSFPFFYGKLKFSGFFNSKIFADGVIDFAELRPSNDPIYISAFLFEA